MESAGRRQSGLLEELKVGVRKMTLGKGDGQVGGALGVSSETSLRTSGVSEPDGTEAQTRYLKIVEQIQAELEEAELEKALLFQERETLRAQVGQLTAEGARAREEGARLERNLQVYMALVDAKTAEVGRTTAELEKVRSEKEFLERNAGQRLERLRREFEGKVEGLEGLVAQMERERHLLHRERERFEDTSLTTEEYSVFLKDKNEDLRRQMVAVRSENEFLKLLGKGLREEVAELTERTAGLRKELDQTRLRAAVEIQETLISCQQRLNQAANGRSGDSGGLKHSELTPLGLEESTLGLSRAFWEGRKLTGGLHLSVPGPEFRETSLFSKSEPRKTSMKAALAALAVSRLDTIGEAPIEPDNSEFSLLPDLGPAVREQAEALAERDRTIDELQRRLFEVTAEREASGAQRDRNALELLRLEVRHLMEQIESLKKSHAESSTANQRFINEIVGDRIHFVQRLQIDLATRDREVAQLNKKLKQLNFVIALYKSQATQFNQAVAAQ